MACTLGHASYTMCLVSTITSTCHFENYHYSLCCPSFKSISDSTWYRAHVGHPSGSINNQSTSSDIHFQRWLSCILHCVPSLHNHDPRLCKSRSTLSMKLYGKMHRSQSPRCTLHLQNLCLLAHKWIRSLFTCNNSWCTLLLINLYGFDILWGTFVLLEVSWFSTIKACTKLTSGLGFGMRFFSPLWISLSVPPFAGMLSHIWLWLGQDTFVFLLGSSFKILVFTTCIDRFSSWHEVLRVTTRFSQLSGKVHISRMAYIASSRGNLAAARWFTYPMTMFMCSTMPSLSLYFSLTIFLIKDVLLRAFFLS